MSPTVTVIVPTHDRPESLGRTIESVIRQTYPAIQIIVVDDGSAIPAAELLRGCETLGRELHVHRRPVAGGPASARNEGLKFAQGDFVAFIDDDDVIVPTAIAYCAEWLCGHPDAIACSSWHRVRHDDGTQVDFRGPTVCDEKSLLWFNGIGILFGLFRWDAAPQELYFDEGLGASEDWDLWLRLARFQPVRVLPLPLYEYRQHSGLRVSRNGLNSLDGRIAFVRRHRSKMSTACLAYHQACIESLRSATPVSVFKGLIRSRTPASAAVFATHVASSRIGAILHDPGLPARAVVRGVRLL